MGGFFSNKQKESSQLKGGKFLSCVSCGLHENAEHPKLPPFGKFKKKILVIGKAPEALDDSRGKPFQDKYGKMIEQALSEVGINLFEDCMGINAVNCFGGDKPLTANSINCCRKRVLDIIKENKPKIIISFGEFPLNTLIASRWKKNMGSIEKWRGWTIPDQDFNAWVCPVYHPEKIEAHKGKEIDTIWFQDLKRISKLIGKPLLTYPKPKIKYIKDLSIFDKLKANSLVSIDYETTGIKPHRKGHEIVCTSVAVSENKAYVFMMPEKKKKRKPFINLLKNRLIKKMAHNMKYEETWSVEILGTSVANWVWDSMLGAHILDNRSGIVSLKFQTYVIFGVVDYASEVTPYLETKGKDSKNANSFNQIKELLKKPGGQKELMGYCALDTINQYRLAVLQIDQIYGKVPDHE